MSSQPSLSLKKSSKAWYPSTPPTHPTIQRRETHKFGTEQLGVIPISVSPPAKKKRTKRTILQQFVASFYNIKEQMWRIYLNSRIYVTWRMVGFQDFCRTSHPSSIKFNGRSQPENFNQSELHLGSTPPPWAPGCNRLWHSWVGLGWNRSPTG